MLVLTGPVGVGKTTVHARLGGRDTGESLAWHRNRAAELMLLMERNALRDVVFDTENRPASDVAREIARYLRWIREPL
jgi:hypothetical protein